MNQTNRTRIHRPEATRKSGVADNQGTGDPIGDEQEEEEHERVQGPPNESSGDRPLGALHEPLTCDSSQSPQSNEDQSLPMEGYKVRIIHLHEKVGPLNAEEDAENAESGRQGWFPTAPSNQAKQQIRRSDFQGIALEIATKLVRQFRRALVPILRILRQTLEAHKLQTREAHSDSANAARAAPRTEPS